MSITVWVWVEDLLGGVLFPFAVCLIWVVVVECVVTLDGIDSMVYYDDLLMVQYVLYGFEVDVRLKFFRRNDPI